MPPRDKVRAAVGFTLYVVLAPALLFMAAGTTRWPIARLYVAMQLASTLGSRLLVLRLNPETLVERARFTSPADVPAGDRFLAPVVGLLAPSAMMLFAGLDHRWGWSGHVPRLGQWTAALAVVGGYAAAVWAMAENQYFSSVARIQGDRGHRVIRSGPYRFVRHPAYAGALVSSLALPFMLEALWALVPALAMTVALVIRTELEDRMLRADLAEYRPYTERTRSRLIPYVW